MTRQVIGLRGEPTTVILVHGQSLNVTHYTHRLIIWRWWPTYRTTSQDTDNKRL